MALKDGFATASESDTFLSDKADWIALTDSQKEDYLQQGRYYIEAEIVKDDISDSEVTDEVKLANCIVAYDLGLGNGLYDGDSRDAMIKYERVDAGEVSSSVSYSGAKGKFRPESYQRAKILLRDFVNIGFLRG